MYSKEENLLITIAVAGFLIAIIFVFFLISIVRQQRKNLKLQKKYLSAEISAREEERKRIASDLHDDVGPVLSTIKFEIDGMETLQPEDESARTNAMAKIDQLTQKMRDISRNLMPSTLLKKGLVYAVEDFLKEMERAAKIPIEYNYTAVSRLSEQQSINCYRLVQETVNNAVKHAVPSRIFVEISEQNKVLKILCKDNGKGFDYNSSLEDGKGLGLKNISTRVELLNGKSIVQSKKGVGTAFLFEIPVSW